MRGIHNYMRKNAHTDATHASGTWNCTGRRQPARDCLLWQVRSARDAILARDWIMLMTCFD